MNRILVILLTLNLTGSFFETGFAQDSLSILSQKPELIGNFNKLSLNSGANGYSLNETVREISSFSLKYNIEPLPAKLQQVIAQTQNVVGVGYFDAAVKANFAQQYGLSSGKKFWASDGAYGRLNQVLQIGSAFEYAYNQSENWIEFGRFFLAQAAISSVGEHLSYWAYVNSSIPVVKNGDEMGWRGTIYPNSHRDHNDAGWMKNTPAGWVNRIIYPKDPKGTVRKESVFLTVPLMYTFSFLMTPNKELKKENKYTKLQPIIYTDGVDYNGVTGPGLGFKLGLQYNIPIKSIRGSNIFFYSSPDLNARLRIAIKKDFVYFSSTIGSNRKGQVDLYGAQFSIFKENYSFVLNYEKKSPVKISGGIKIKF